MTFHVMVVSFQLYWIKGLIRFTLTKCPCEHHLLLKLEAIPRTQQLRSELQQSYFEEALNNAHTVKQKWQAIKKYWPYMSKNTKITKIGDETDPSRMADLLNEFFANIGNNLATKIPPRNVNPVPMTQMPPALEFHELSLLDVVNVIREFKSSNSAGVDGITSRILKAGGPTIYPVLLHLINSSISQKTFPSCCSDLPCHPPYIGG